MGPSPVIKEFIARRKVLGLTQRQVAEIIGCSHQYVSQLEIGHVTPSVVTAAKLLAAVGLQLCVVSA